MRVCRTWFGSRRLCLFRILTHQWMNKAHGRLTLQAGGCSCQGGVPDPPGPCRSLSTGCCPEQGKQTLGCFVSRLILDRPTPEVNGATGDASPHGSSVPCSLRQWPNPPELRNAPALVRGGTGALTAVPCRAAGKPTMEEESRSTRNIPAN